MYIEKLMNRIIENIISGIEKKGEVFFFFLASSFSFSLSFYSIRKPNPHMPPIHFYSPKKI
jgi:hypothetical protein